MNNFEFNRESENWVIRVTFKIMVMSLAVLGVFIGALTYGEKIVAWVKKLWTMLITKRKEKKDRGYTEMDLGDNK